MSDKSGKNEQKSTKLVDFSEGIKAFYDNLPVVAVICDKSFSICWENRQAQKWDGEPLQNLLTFPSDEQTEIFSQIQKNQETNLMKEMGITSYKLCLRSIDDNHFLAEIRKQKHRHPFWFSQRENLLLASLEENIRIWVSDIFSILEPVQRGLQMSEKYKEAKLVDNIFQNCMSILKFIDTYSDYQSLIQSDVKDAIYWDTGKELRNICEVVKAETQFHDVPFSFENIPDEEIICKVNPREFRRAVLHLISNAFKFKNPGNEVSVRTFQQKDCFFIQVSDKGMGIPMQDFNKIFDPFYSYDPNTQMPAGAGIGLPYVKAFMEKYHQANSSPVLESRENIGTKVTISLPMEKGSKANTLQNEKVDPTDVLRGKYSIYQIYLSDILK